jgi:uncharacterized protein
MNEAKQPRAVIDTNLIVSGLISPRSFSAQIFTAWENNLFTWVLSQEILAEIKDVLERDSIKKSYHIQQEQIASLMNNLMIACEHVIPYSEDLLPIHSRDPKDDKFLACVLSGKCDYLVSADPDLLVLKKEPQLTSLQILTAEQFLQAIHTAA